MEVRGILFPEFNGHKEHRLHHCWTACVQNNCERRSVCAESFARCARGVCVRLRQIPTKGKFVSWWK